MGELICVDLGLAEYGATFDLQQQLVKRVRASEEGLAYLLLVEHDPPVVTLGRSAREEHVIGTAEDLAREGIEVHQVNRGGDVTYHGRGQLVGYPILRLDAPRRGVRQYLRGLEEVLIRLLGRFGIEGRRTEGLTGVWVGDEKIAAIGVAVRQWVTYHGFALNVAANLKHFELIVACGLSDRGVTDMSGVVGRPVTVAEVKEPLIECVMEVFGFDGARQEEAGELRHGLDQ